MVKIDTLRKAAMTFPEASEEPHFEKTSFRVKKKIFVTIDISKNLACFKLSEIDRDTFSSIHKAAIYPIPNKWGKLGWTFVELKKVNKALLIDILTTAYCEVAPKILAEQVRTAGNAK